MSRLKKALMEVEFEMIKEALKKHDYNRTQTALDLGISRPALIYKIKDYGLPTKTAKRSY